MKVFSTYSVKIKHYNHVFKETISLYRDAVNFLIGVCLDKWDIITTMNQNLLRQQYVERLCHKTKDNPDVSYPFDRKFYKFPSYLRRSAISEAIGKVSSYKSKLANWESEDPKTRGRKPSFPKTGYVYPSMYRTVMYEQSGDYEMKIKVFVRNTWAG